MRISDNKVRNDSTNLFHIENKLSFYWVSGIPSFKDSENKIQFVYYRYIPVSSHIFRTALKHTIMLLLL